MPFSGVQDSTAKLYLPTILRWSFVQNVDSTAELLKMRSLRRMFSKKDYWGQLFVISIDAMKNKYIVSINICAKLSR